MGSAYRAGWPACLLVFLLAAGLPAEAVEDPDPDFSLDDTVKVGPFHAAPFLVIKDFGYDDNIRLQPDGLAQGDYTITVGPGARAVTPFGRRAALALWDEIDYVAYAQNPDLNSVNNEFRSKLHVYMRENITLLGHLGWRSVRERPNNDIDFRTRHNTTTGRFGTLYRPEKRGQIELFLDRKKDEYKIGNPDIPDDTIDEETAIEIGERRTARLNRTATVWGVDTRLEIRPRTTLLFDAETGPVDFDLAEPDRDSRTSRSTVGLEFDPSGPLRGFFRLGLANLTPDSNLFKGYSGLVGRGELSLRLLQRSRGKLQYNRDTVFSSIVNNLYYLNRTWGLAYEHFLSRRLSFELGRMLSRNDYPQEIVDFGDCRTDPSGQLACDEKLRVDHITSNNLTLHYTLRPGVRLGVTYRLWDRDSNFDSQDVTRHTFWTSVEYVP